MNLRFTVSAAIVFFSALSACSKDAGTTTPEARGLSISVAPLSLVGVTEALYTLTVKSATGVVWSKSDLKSTEYGDGKGALTYIGTCDASANPHTVELELQSLWKGANEITEFSNPAPVGKPLIKANVNCIENGDVPVTFNLTILREANQGFFDIGVTFSDIFCSAKVDCLEDPLLHIPGADRGPTAVMAFACTSGADLQGNPEDTFLHLTNVTVECGVAPNVTTHTVFPNGRPGNLGDVTPIFFQTGLYKGQEQLPGYDKCYWNLAFGVNETAAASNCRIIAQGTASDSSWTDEEGEDGHSPGDTVYPYVDFNVQITDLEGDLNCGTTANATKRSHPLNGAGSGVTTQYTGFGGATFTHEWQCGTDLVTTEKVSCSGLVQGQTSAGAAAFIQTPAGVQVAFGNSWSPLYELPGELQLDDCCMNPCCTVNDGGQTP